jgi:hypothetical protein
VRWLKAEPPVIYEKTFLEFTGYKTISKRDDPHEVRRLHFNVSGSWM